MAAQDVILIGVLLFTLGLGLFIIHFVMTTISDNMLDVTEINQSDAAVEVFEGMDEVASRFDAVVFGLFIGLVLALIISSWFIGGHPIFMFIYFIVVVLGVVLSTVLSNTWETATNMAAFGSTIAAFPITNNLLLRLPIYLSVVGFIGLVIMFAKPYMEQQ